MPEVSAPQNPFLWGQRHSFGQRELGARDEPDRLGRIEPVSRERPVFSPSSPITPGCQRRNRPGLYVRFDDNRVSDSKDVTQVVIRVRQPSTPAPKKLLQDLRSSISFLLSESSTYFRPSRASITRGHLLSFPRGHQVAFPVVNQAFFPGRNFHLPSRALESRRPVHVVFIGGTLRLFPAHHVCIYCIAHFVLRYRFLA